MTEIVHFARCPEHGLHGQRTRCYECGAEVEQVPMASAAALEAAERRIERARIVAEYWVDVLLAAPGQVPVALAAHPVACVLMALDGGTGPRMLGVGPGAHYDRLEALR